MAAQERQRKELVRNSGVKASQMLREAMGWKSLCTIKRLGVGGLGFRFYLFRPLHHVLKGEVRGTFHRRVPFSLGDPDLRSNNRMGH